VAIEPSDPADMGALKKGLRQLNRADPFVEVTVSARGEHVLAAAGEVHLERCVKDLKERFAKVSLEVSPPLVSYRETVQGEALNPLDDLNGCCISEVVTANGRCVVRVRVMKLPTPLTELLDKSCDLLGEIIGAKSKHAPKSLEEDGNQTEALRKRMIDAVENDLSSRASDIGSDRIEKCRESWRSFFGRIWALGPGEVGPNILLTPPPPPPGSENSSNGSVLVNGRPYASERLGFCDNVDDTTCSSSTMGGDEMLLMKEAESLESSVVSGFQLATSAGPLCDEPMWGLCFTVEANLSRDSASPGDQYGGSLGGQVMTTVKEACRAAVLQNRPRIVEGFYFCELSTPTEYLGSTYAVLARRRARVLKEEMQEGSALFCVNAYVPVAESFGFGDELRRWTSGASSALLVFSHWGTLAEDPFFVPKTEEEIEEYGDGSNVPRNISRKLIDAVRRRKGLAVEEKVVEHATKQRTRARKV
ncbi:hypothetical protein M569_02434, partial [Genlisea aurea]